MLLFHFSSHSVYSFQRTNVLAFVRLYLSSSLPPDMSGGFGAFAFKWKSQDHLTCIPHVYEIHLTIDGSRSSRLTIVALVKDDELLPVQLRDEGKQDVVDANRWTCGQCVALSVWAGVELAGGAGRTIPVSLDEEVGNVHRICQGLQGTRRRTACRCDQGEDPLVHQLTCWTRGKRMRMKDKEVRKGMGEKKSINEDKHGFRKEKRGGNEIKQD